MFFSKKTDLKDIFRGQTDRPSFKSHPETAAVLFLSLWLTRKFIILFIECRIRQNLSKLRNLKRLKISGIRF